MIQAIVVLFLLQADAAAPERPARERRAAQSRAARTEGATNTASEASSDGGKGKKVKTYTFSGLDVEGKLKTPQLLYFLNRVRLEFETSGAGKRSFMKELERTAEDGNL